MSARMIRNHRLLAWLAIVLLCFPITMEFAKAGTPSEISKGEKFSFEGQRIKLTNYKFTTVDKFNDGSQEAKWTAESNEIYCIIEYEWENTSNKSVVCSHMIAPYIRYNNKTYYAGYFFPTDMRLNVWDASMFSLNMKSKSFSSGAKHKMRTSITLPRAAKQSGEVIVAFGYSDDFSQSEQEAYFYIRKNKATKKPTSTPSPKPVKTPRPTAAAQHSAQTGNTKGFLQIRAEGDVNIRSGADSGTEKIGTAKAKEIFLYIGVENGWYQIIMENGLVGYVASGLVTILQ